MPVWGYVLYAVCFALAGFGAGYYTSKKITFREPWKPDGK
jgi:hypothetical protein